jgi:hypothetical protein
MTEPCISQVLTVHPVLQIDFQTVANDSVMYGYSRAH